VREITLRSGAIFLIETVIGERAGATALRCSVRRRRREAMGRLEGTR
jgi:hypothetical protein